MPITQLMQLVDKEIKVKGSGFINNKEMSCIYVGSHTGSIDISAIYVASTEIICPLPA